MDRRSALKGMAGIICSAMAPAIIPIKNIMPVKLIIPPEEFFGTRVQFSQMPHGPNLSVENLIMRQLAEAMAISMDELITDINNINYGRG